MPETRPDLATAYVALLRSIERAIAAADELRAMRDALRQATNDRSAETAGAAR